MTLRYSLDSSRQHVSWQIRALWKLHLLHFKQDLELVMHFYLIDSYSYDLTM